MTQPIVVENFAADTGQFTVIGEGTHGPGGFAITGGQGVFTNAPSGGNPLPTVAVDTANMPVASGVPAIFVYATLGTPTIPRPPAGTYGNIMPGIALDPSYNIQFELGSNSGSPLDVGYDILLFIGGGQHQLGGGRYTPPSAIDAVGFSLEGNRARGWGLFGSVWTLICDVDVSGIYDFTAPGATTGWHASIGAVSDGGMTIAVTELWSGPPFAVSVVPNVVGEDITTAEADIIAAGLTVGTVTTIADPSPPGTVLSQSVAPGLSVAPGTAIDLVQASGVAVPSVINTSATVVAPGILAAAGFIVGTITYIASAVIIAGNVVSQSPVAGAEAGAGSAVNLVVSSGLPALTVPDIFGLSQADAETALTSLGLVVGAVGSAPSPFVPPGTVQTQNPSAGTPVGPGTIVSFVLSLGTPAVGTAFDFEATVISQYANSPVIMQLVQNLNQYIDQSTNFANFFNFVWNVDTAVGFGLDIWGKIVGVSRLLQIPNTTDYVGFDNGTRSPPDWQSMGSDQPPQPAVGGALYTGYNATSTYLLGDDAYRQLILAKAFANICTTTAPALNTILQNLYGPGTAWVLNTGPMAISYNLNFTPSAIQLAILEQSGVIPTPPGVSVVIVTP